MKNLAALPLLLCSFLIVLGACVLDLDEPAGSDEDLQAVQSEIKGGSPKLSIVRDGNGAGDVRSADGVIQCGSMCTGTFKPSTTVTLTAVPRWDSRFVGSTTLVMRDAAARSTRAS